MTAATAPCPATITALILAGGASSRMGGIDKGLVDVAGHPLVEHVAARLSPQVAGVLISANRNLPLWRRYGWPVLTDAAPAGRGPLAGILAGLEQCPTDWLLVVPCDAPALPQDLAARLAAADPSRPLRVAHAGGDWQPVCALLHRRLAPDLREFLDHAAGAPGAPGGQDAPGGQGAQDAPGAPGAPGGLDAPGGQSGQSGQSGQGAPDAAGSHPRKGGGKVMAWMTRHAPVAVHWPDAAAFINLNTREELHAWAGRLPPRSRPGPPLWVGRAPVLGVAAASGTGKTTLLEATLPHLVAAGLRVTLVKHAHHDFDIDQPGKDSHRLRQAGASQVVVGSARRVASIIERADTDLPLSLDELLTRIDPGQTDLVLVEGFKRDPIPRLALARAGAPSPPVPLEDPWLVALASDGPVAPDCGLTWLDIDDPAAVAAFLIRWRRERLLQDLPTEPT